MKILRDLFYDKGKLSRKSVMWMAALIVFLYGVVKGFIYEIWMPYYYVYALLMIMGVGMTGSLYEKKIVKEREPDSYIRQDININDESGYQVHNLEDE